MAMIGKPRGTRDFTPAEMQQRRTVERATRSVFERYGYGEIATPVIEHMELFTMKSGEEVIEETYEFEDKSGRHLALRPELTAPAMRFYVEQLQMEPKPLKLYYFGPCYRYDRPQAGRYREFWQMGCELIGTDTPEAIAELISLAYHAVKEPGLQDVELRIGDLTLLRFLMEQLGIERQGQIMRLLDKHDDEGLDALLDQEQSETLRSFLACRTLEDVASMVDEEQVTRLREVLDWLDVFAVPTTLDPSIARGLDYYTGIVFEIDAPSLGAEKQICGGGEYSLVPLLGGSPVATAGFALGFDRILLALEEEGRTVASRRDLVYVAPVSDAMRRPAARVAMQLRQAGRHVELDLMRRSMGKSLQHADRLGATTAIIVGDEEWERNAVMVKDMKSGEQQEVAVDELAGATS
ncbi:MAG: histidine--tRNA ligase [Thermoplasmatota archaeon]